MPDVSKDALKKVPYISNLPEDGRIVFLEPFIDKTDNVWKWFAPQGKNLELMLGEPVESCYYAESIVDESSDVYLKIVDVIAQHYSFPPVLKILLRTIRNIINCGVVVEKYFLFLTHYRETKDTFAGNLVATDLEYLFGNVRSLYDLEQQMFGVLWQKTAGHGGIKLKDSFTSMVEMSGDQLRAKYKLPDAIIDYYHASRPFFMKVRNLRDAIHHFPAHHNIGYPVLCLEDGFALTRDDFSQDLISFSFDIWPDEKVKVNGLVSVLALVAYVNKQVLLNTSAFSDALVDSVNPPRPISETHKVYLRSPFVHHLLKLDKYLTEQWVVR